MHTRRERALCELRGGYLNSARYNMRSTDVLEKRGESLESNNHSKDGKKGIPVPGIPTFVVPHRTCTGSTIRPEHA